MGLAMRVEAHAIACGVRLGLRLLPLSRVAALLLKLPRARTSSTRDPRECATAAHEAARRAAHPTCLFRALTAFAMLVRRGYAARLALGAAHAGEFAAHAWVTVDGAAIEPCDREYVPLWSCGASAAGTS
jgi:hypothetical protein